MKKTLLQNTDNMIGAREGSPLRIRMGKPKVERHEGAIDQIMRMVRANSRRSGIGNNKSSSVSQRRVGRGIIVRPRPLHN